MRIAVAVAAALATSPAAAQPTAAVPEVPKELTDPAMAEKLARVMQALSKSFLELPVGEIGAAVDGREPTEADRKRTVRSEGRKDDPDFDRDFERRMANAKPMMEAAMKAMAAALPAMMDGMARAGKELEKARDNLPSPNYPKQ